MRSTPCELALPQDVSAPRIARRTLNEWFATSLADDGLDTAKLLVSELVTNALLHGQGTITLRPHLDDDRLLIEVMDEGPGFERTVRDADFEMNGGLGLGLVDSESNRWGVQEGTTHVWFELDRSGPLLGPAKQPPVREVPEL
ncbi:MAG TPA: ATP-binding protein [Solirubrobacteraceae bacterium]|nr:ATP-binding protein [Solirubrobacteraceae bacterium]